MLNRKVLPSCFWKTKVGNYFLVKTCAINASVFGDRILRKVVEVFIACDALNLSKLTYNKLDKIL